MQPLSDQVAGTVPYHPPCHPRLSALSYDSGERMGHSKLTLKDGTELAYDILGSEHLGHALPLVMIGGMRSVRTDSLELAAILARRRPGEPTSQSTHPND